MAALPSSSKHRLVNYISVELRSMAEILLGRTAEKGPGVLQGTGSLYAFTSEMVPTSQSCGCVLGGALSCHTKSVPIKSLLVVSPLPLTLEPVLTVRPVFLLRSPFAVMLITSQKVLTLIGSLPSALQLDRGPGGCQAAAGSHL